MRLLLEFIEIVDYLRAKECFAIYERRLVDDHICTSGFDSLHDSQDCRLAEVIATALHGQTIYSNDTLVLFAAIPLTVLTIVTSLVKDGICNIIFTSAITLYNY